MLRIPATAAAPARLAVTLVAIGLVAGSIALTTGCSTDAPTTDEGGGAASSRPMGADDVRLDSSVGEDSSPDVAYPLTTCVVSGEELGAMGPPVEVRVDGRTVFLCCTGCEERLRANPAKYLAKLDRAAATDATDEATDPSAPDAHVDH